MDPIFIPIAGMMTGVCIMAVIAVIIFIIFSFRHRERTKLHDTLKALAESNSPHQAELLAMLAKSTVPVPQRDLRAAIMLIGTGLGFMAMGFLIGMEDGGYYEVIWPLVAISIFPFAFGIGRLLLWRMAVKRGED